MSCQFRRATFEGRWSFQVLGELAGTVQDVEESKDNPTPFVQAMPTKARQEY